MLLTFHLLLPAWLPGALALAAAVTSSIAGLAFTLLIVHLSSSAIPLGRRLLGWTRPTRRGLSRFFAGLARVLWPHWVVLRQGRWQGARRMVRRHRVHLDTGWKENRAELLQRIEVALACIPSKQVAAIHRANLHETVADLDEIISSVHGGLKAVDDLVLAPNQPPLPPLAVSRLEAA